MTAPRDEAELRHWLVDYLVTTIGCSPDDIDFDASLNDLGVGSRDSVVLSGELSELLGRPVSPVEFWQHPTISELARFLSGTEPEAMGAGTVDASARLMDEPIAVIGLGCRFPGEIAGPDEYWQFLAERRSAVGTVPPDRWPQFDDGSPEVAAAMARTTRWGSFLADVDAFDADFFEISPGEAAKMDPQQRLLLEVAYEALEHAGIGAHSLRHTQTGVFAGACVSEYGYLATTDLSQVDSWSGTGAALSIIANRVSYYFDLRGPSVTVDTACSSSLVAIHLACQSLRNGDSNLALAAGVNLLLAPAVTRSFDRAEAMSPTGACHAFDASADGFVRGEGAGVVVLKRLSDAQRDGDPVLAVVRGSAVNQDGRSNGLMAPNPAAQMAVLRTAYANAGVEPLDVDYVEAHGTGTLLGDPIEARALGSVLGRARPAEAPLLLGAVKSNLGHLEAAAGIAGFIKTVLAVQRGHIPANQHFDTPNPHIPFPSLRLKVVAEHTDWPQVDRPRLAGVSSFGFGGTNAHVVVEQAPVEQTAPGAPGPAVSTLVVSGKSADRVATMAGALADWMAGAGSALPLADVAHTVNHHRSRHPKFATVSARERDQAVAGLRALAAGDPAPGVVPVHDGRCKAGTVFVYSGQGSQWTGMGRRLLADEPAFAAAVAELEPDFVAQVGFSLQQVLSCGDPVVGIDRIQPVLVGVQLALTALWRSYGVQPDAVIGHSMGEVTAAVVSGALSPADGLKVIATRSRLMSQLSGQGAMALVELDADAAQALAADFDGLTVAVYASPRQSVIAGPPEQVDAAIAVVAAQDRLARRIEVEVASHHPIIDPVLAPLRSALADLAPRTPTTPLITTTLDPATGMSATFDADYWAANLRNPVRFHQAVAAAGADYATFVEVSPNPVLTHAIDDILAQTHHHSIATLQRDTDDALTFHTNLNATHTTAPPVTDHPAGPHPALPTTPWHRTRHWIARRQHAPAAATAPMTGTLLGEQISVATTPPTHLWRARLVPDAKPYPGSHRIHGLEVVPISVLLQTLSAAAAQCGAARLHSIRFEYPIVVDQPRVVQVIADGDSVTVSSSPMADTPAHRWVRHVSAKYSELPDDTVPPEVISAADSHDVVRHQNRSVAQLLNDWGVDGQPFEWTVDSLRPGVTGMTAAVRLTEPSTVALLDAAVHVARMVDRSNPRLMVPSSVESVSLAGTLTQPAGIVEVRRRDSGNDDLVVDIAVKASDGRTCVDIRSLRFVDVESGPVRADVDPRSLAHAIEWQPWHVGEELAAPAGARTLAVVGAAGADREPLLTALAGAGYQHADVADARYVVYVAEPESGDRDLDAAVRMTTEVSDLVRRLANREHRRPATLWLLTRGVREAASDTVLAQSALWGIAAVIAAEEPEQWGGLVDIPSETPVEDYAPALATVLGSPSKSVLAWDGGVFLAPAVVPITGEPVRAALRCRPDAAYLITGGMGALGLLAAGWLADHGARRIVLTGRTPLPPRRDWDSANADVAQPIAAIRDLEMRGVSIEVVALDIGSPAAVEDLLARRDRDGAPPIRGVIHAAGVTENKLLTDTTDSTLRNVMWPKIAGAQVLHKAFPPGTVDFCYLTASAGTIFGVPGQGAYAAGNAYLDAWARARHRQGCHTLSMDWVAWRGLGFASDAAVVVAELERIGSRPVGPEEAFAAWEYADRYDIAQAVMVPMPSVGATTSQDCNAHHAANVPVWSQLARPDVMRVLQDGLQSILARELRMSESDVERDRPFAELGLNSVMAMSIRREAEALVGIELSATMLWNHPTIEALAVHLAEKVAPATGSDSGPVRNGESPDSECSVLDSLFDSVESSPAGVESGI